MKLLLIMRHAKSSRDDPGLKDFDRPLNERGQQQVLAMGALLKKKKLIPDRIVSSPALRAKATAEEVARGFNYRGEIQWQEKFYGAGPDEYVKGLQAVADSFQKVMIVGHNPGLEILLKELLGQEETLPTAAIACLELPIERWQDLNLNIKARLQHLWRPQEIG